jgi:hypothetical protein
MGGRQRAGCRGGAPFHKSSQRTAARPTHALAAATTLAAAAGDYIVVPKRFTPGFEYHLPVAHIAAVYLAFGAGLVLPFLIKPSAR